MMNKNYRESFAISQSSIKDFITKSPKKWKSIWINNQEDTEKKEDNYTNGSLVDCLLFTPNEINNRYSIADAVLPKKAIGSIVKSTYDTIIERNRIAKEVNDRGEVPIDIPMIPFDLEENKNIILHHANLYKEKEDDAAGWNMGWLEKTRINKIIEIGKEYFQLLVKANGKKVITLQMNLEGIESKEILHKDPSTRPYFIADEGIELIHQDEIFVNHETKFGTIPLKGAIDINRIDHNAKTIQECDFKTGFSAFDFLQSIKKFGYTRQHSFYNYLLTLKYADLISKKYTILPPINIVMDKSNIPYIYEFDWLDIRLERDGNERYLYDMYGENHNFRIKKGWKQVLEDIAWHIQQDLWDKQKELYTTVKIKVNLRNS